MEHPDSELNSDPTPAFQTLPQGPRPADFAFLAPPQTSDEIGRLGRFRVLKLLGEGGMGMVFLATDPDLDRRVALKVMKPEAASHTEGRKRFLREARTAAAVEQDNVVAILQVGEDGGVPFLVMPLLKGESLEDRLRRTPKLSSAEAARVGRETADGLAAAHAVGLVHRDIKPSNLWLEQTADGRERIKVLDFGLARPVEDAENLTRTNSLMGTAGYMAPEQARAEQVDSRADLFSLGCVLYRMCTGHAPFRGDTLTAVLLQLTTHNPSAPHVVDPTVSAALSDLIMRLLAKAPTDRLASARQVADALRAIEFALPPTTVLPTRPTTPPTALAETVSSPVAKTNPGVSASSPKPPRRRWTFTFSISITLAFGVLAAVAALQYYPGRVSHPSEPPLAAVRPTSLPPSPLFKGSIDILVFDPWNPHGQVDRLNAPNVLPLKPGDRFSVEATIDPPAYLYILWIDADGSVDPVYPWKPGHWDERPAEEKPLGRLMRPEESGHWFKIKESAPGMETLVLLARATPLPADVDLKAELGPVRPQTLQTPQSLKEMVWCENGKEVKNEAGRSAADWDDEKIDDPVRATQEQIQSRLGRLFPYTRTVSFAVRGK